MAHVANNARYIRGYSGDLIGFEDLLGKEILTPEQQYNEYVMTSLRTMWGCSLDKIDPEFKSHFLAEIRPFQASGHVERCENAFVLTAEGKLLADRVAMEVFV